MFKTSADVILLKVTSNEITSMKVENVITVVENLILPNTLQVS